MNLNHYQTLVFDCDGVVLNSNKVKTEAFFETALSFGRDKAQALVDYHVQHGGVSRYLKFEYFIEKILHRPLDDVLLDKLLAEFAMRVKTGLMQSDIAPGLHELREQTAHANWLIVSGGDQAELREVFAERKLYELFDSGIFGSPDDKDTILERQLSKQVVQIPALFVGDSKYDFRAASRAGLDFVFLTNWTEVKDWREFREKHGFPVMDCICSLIQNK